MLSHRRGSRAFTLVELIVVLVVLGVLAALAIPTFAAVKKGASQRMAETTAQAIAREANAIESQDVALENLDANVETGALEAGIVSGNPDYSWDAATNTVYTYPGSSLEGSAVVEYDVTSSDWKVGLGAPGGPPSGGGDPGPLLPWQPLYDGGSSSPTDGVKVTVPGDGGDQLVTILPVGDSNGVGIGLTPDENGNLPSGLTVTPVGTLPLGVGVDPNTGAVTVDSTYPTTPQPLAQWTAAGVSSGGRNSCAVTAGEGRVLCWGFGSGGMLGNGVAGDGQAAPLPVSVYTLDVHGVPQVLTGMSSVTVGSSDTCAVKAADGSVWCWGAAMPTMMDAAGVYLSTYANVPYATRVTGAVGASQVAALYASFPAPALACAVTTGANLTCWGEGPQYDYVNSVIPLISPTVMNFSGPIADDAFMVLDPLVKGVTFFAGVSHSGWPAPPESLPVQGTVTSVFTTSDNELCFVADANTEEQDVMWCSWVSSDPGSSEYNHWEVTPRMKSPGVLLSGVVYASRGDEDSRTPCVVTAPDGNVWCWPGNSLPAYPTQVMMAEGVGAYGLHSLPGSEPVKVPLTGAVQVATAFRTACALMGSGEIWCWGTAEYNGERGDGTLGVFSADSYGDGYGPGDGVNTFDSYVSSDALQWSWVPTKVYSGFDEVSGTDSGTGVLFSAVSGSYYNSGGGPPLMHMCALVAPSQPSSGTVRCWGTLNGGVVGDGTLPNQDWSGFYDASLPKYPTYRSSPATVAGFWSASGSSFMGAGTGSPSLMERVGDLPIVLDVAWDDNGVTRHKQVTMTVTVVDSALVWVDWTGAPVG